MLLPPLEPLKEAVIGAGAITMRYWRTDVKVHSKGKEGPVTRADREADAYIVNALRLLSPEYPVVSEEGEKPIVNAATQPFWLVDPLDGTRSFIADNPEFTVNIALVVNRQPVLGLLYHPPSETLYWMHNGETHRQKGDAAAERIHMRPLPESGLTVYTSKSHRSPDTDAWLDAYPHPITNRIRMGSSLKFARVAEASGDLYLRLGPTMEWDTAAGHALIIGAGGTVENLDGTPLEYGKPGYKNPGMLGRII